MVLELKNRKTGRFERVGFRKRKGGGYERGVVRDDVSSDVVPSRSSLSAREQIGKASRVVESRGQEVVGGFSDVRGGFSLFTRNKAEAPVSSAGNVHFVGGGTGTVSYVIPKRTGGRIERDNRNIPYLPDRAVRALSGKVERPLTAFARGVASGRRSPATTITDLRRGGRSVITGERKVSSPSFSSEVGSTFGVGSLVAEGYGFGALFGVGTKAVTSVGASYKLVRSRNLPSVVTQGFSRVGSRAGVSLVRAKDFGLVNRRLARSSKFVSRGAGVLGGLYAGSVGFEVASARPSQRANIIGREGLRLAGFGKGFPKGYGKPLQSVSSAGFGQKKGDLLFLNNREVYGSGTIEQPLFDRTARLGRGGYSSRTDLINVPTNYLLSGNRAGFGGDLFNIDITTGTLGKGNKLSSERFTGFLDSRTGRFGAFSKNTAIRSTPSGRVVTSPFSSDAVISPSVFSRVRDDSLFVGRSRTELARFRKDFVSGDNVPSTVEGVTGLSGRFVNTRVGRSFEATIPRSSSRVGRVNRALSNTLLVNPRGKAGFYGSELSSLQVIKPPKVVSRGRVKSVGGFGLVDPRVVIPRSRSSLFPVRSGSLFVPSPSDSVSKFIPRSSLFPVRSGSLFVPSPSDSVSKFIPDTVVIPRSRSSIKFRPDTVVIPRSRSSIKFRPDTVVIPRSRSSLTPVPDGLFTVLPPPPSPPPPIIPVVGIPFVPPLFFTGGGSKRKGGSKGVRYGYAGSLSSFLIPSSRSPVRSVTGFEIRPFISPKKKKKVRRRKK